MNYSPTSRATKKMNFTNKSLLVKQILYYFQHTKYVVYLNGNTPEGIDYIAISSSKEVYEKDWQFGFVSYDYKNKVENLTSNNPDNIQLPIQHFFSPELLFIINAKKIELSFIKKKYTSTEIDCLISEICSQEIAPLLPTKKRTLKKRSDKSTYLETLKKIKDHLLKGDIYEINYCQEFFIENEKHNPLALYFNLNDIAPAPFSCFVKHEDKYILSSSMERFVQKKGEKIISEPIKGTIKRGKTADEDEHLMKELENNKKERAENIMVVDLVRNDLSKIAKKGSVMVEELCKIYTFPQVHQMISKVSARVDKNIPFPKVLQALFPMGSMTGVPKVKALTLIEKYEAAKRGIYSGTVGYITPDNDFDFNVIIRTIVYCDKTKYLSCIVGSAITHLSDPELEYEECLLKTKGILKALNATL